MKTMVLTALGGLAAASLLAAPALAQPYGAPPPGAHMGYGDQPGGWEVDRRIHWIQDRITHGRDDGSLDRHEFRRVQMELNHIRRDEQSARAVNGGHLPPPVRADLEGRLSSLNDQIHWLRQNNVRRPW
jgi:hypothetical protein